MTNDETAGPPPWPPPVADLRAALRLLVRRPDLLRLLAAVSEGAGLPRGVPPGNDIAASVRSAAGGLGVLPRSITSPRVGLRGRPSGRR
jgi:hypothetical protein